MWGAVGEIAMYQLKASWNTQTTGQSTYQLQRGVYPLASALVLEVGIP